MHFLLKFCSSAGKIWSPVWRSVEKSAGQPAVRVSDVLLSHFAPPLHTFFYVSTTPPHFSILLCVSTNYHPYTLFIHLYHPCTLFICLYHTFVHPMIRRRFVGKTNTWGFLGQSSEKNIFFTVSLTEWVVPPIDQWFVIFFFLSWHILDNLTIL